MLVQEREQLSHTVVSFGVKNLGSLAVGDVGQELRCRGGGGIREMRQGFEAPLWRGHGCGLLQRLTSCEKADDDQVGVP